MLRIYTATPSARILTARGTQHMIRSLMTSQNNYTSTSPFKFKFIPSVNKTTNNIPTPTPTPIQNTTTEQRKLTSHALPSKDILNKHTEAVKAKERDELEKLNKAKEIIKQARESGAISTQHTSTITTTTTATTTTSSSTAAPEKKKKKKRTLRARKAVITLSPTAISHLQALLELPEPQMIRVSTKNRGCSGTQYDLSYVTKPEKFDEIVEQDGIKIIIDSKALFSVVGSEMDWIDDQLNTKFIFKNPNSKGTCGCGESFMT